MGNYVSFISILCSFIFWGRWRDRWDLKDFCVVNVPLSCLSDISCWCVFSSMHCTERLVNSWYPCIKMCFYLVFISTSSWSFFLSFFWFTFWILNLMVVAEWWSTYGGGCPNLARLAIRILSQTCSLIYFKQNQIPYEQMHDTRNCLERQRLNDLVFVQKNLWLKQM